MLRNFRVGRRFVPAPSRTPRLLFSIIAALLWCGALRADTSLQNKTVTLLPQNLFASECLMTSDDGFPTRVYGTAPTEGNQFVFHDPLPEGAIVVSMQVTVSSMASCQPSPSLAVKLNPDRPDVPDFFSRNWMFVLVCRKTAGWIEPVPA